MSSGITETATIEANIAIINEWEGQLLRLSMRKRLLQKYSANTIDQIHAKYKPKKEIIRNKIDSLDKKTSTDEYRALMDELNELENQEDTEIKAEEQRASDTEEPITTQMTELETKSQAARKDNEALKELRKSNQETSFGYFNS